MPRAVSSPSITLAVGEEEFLASRAVSTVLSAARGRDEEADIRDLDGAGLAVDAVADALTPSLFGGERVVVIRNAHECDKQAQAALLRLLDDLPDDTAVVLTHRGGAKGKALLDGLRGRARVVECEPIKRPSDRQRFVEAEARVAGGEITRDAVAALIDAVGTDLRELSTAITQLVADHPGRIDVDVVARYHRGKADATGFAIADRAVEGDAAGALELLRWGLAVGLPPVLVTSALASNLRTLARVGDAGRERPLTLAKQLGMPPWKIEKAQRQLRGWRPEGLATAITVVAAADAAVKGAEEDAAHAVERTLLAVVGERGR